MTATLEQVEYMNSDKCRALIRRSNELWRFACDARYFGYNDVAAEAEAECRAIRQELDENGYFDVYDEDIPF